MTDDWKSKYDSVESFYEGLAKVKLGDDETGKYGYVDQQGQEYWDMSEDEARQQMKNR